jgi:RNA polymerase sigma factor (sigma-70 family)
MQAREKSMPTRPLHGVIQQLRADLGPDGGGMTDGELLARFLSRRDDHALAALVRRHAAMVWGVCRRLLHRHQDAEDAFQATFLVLVRKAADVPRPAVANWLYGVARQTAVRLRATAAKRGRREAQVVTMPEPTVAEGRDADLPFVLDEELSRLPGHYRGALVLCDLEGMTRKEAARQLGIPEGSVASRLARARALLAKRLTRRGVVFSGGSVAAALSAGSAPASAPPALVTSTIEAATLLAAGRAAGVVSAKVAALTEGVVKAMFVTKIKGVLAVVLIVAALAGAAGLIYQTRAVAQSQPPANKDQNMGDEKQARANPPVQPNPQPVKTDQERMVGNWFITNDDSTRKGEMWVITEDSILMHAKNLGVNAYQYFHRIDADKAPKQIDITVKKVNGPPIGVIKCIYVLDGDELRLCLGGVDKDRPTAFPKKPGQGEVLVLQRKAPGGEQPKAKEEQSARSDLERMAGLWTIVNGNQVHRDDGLGSKGQVWDIGKHQIVPDPFLTGKRTRQYFHRLDSAKTPKQIDITVTAASSSIGTEIPTEANAQVIGVIKGIYELDRGELRLCLGEMGKDRPAAFPEKSRPGEVLVLHRGALDAREKLRLLIDQVLAAQGGEDRLRKLQFTMAVKHSNGYINQYFVQPPKNFRWETTFPNQTGKRIVILFPEGRRWWTKEPNAEPKGFIPTGIEAPLAFWHDYVKFFGPRQVLRLKDADHKVALLDEEATIGDRAAVGVQITGPLCTQKMYFDKETHLLLKGVGSDIVREVTFSDYKTFDGIPIAQKEHDGHYEPVVTDFRAVDKFDAKLFEQP